MAIQFRRGAFADFIKSKMVAGEPAVVQSGDTSTQNGKAFYICYTPGSVDRVLTEQDKTALDSQISDIEDDLAAAEQTIESVRQSIPAVDNTLTQAGAAADAKKTGDEIADLKSDLAQAEPGVWTDTAKTALLDCLAHVAWSDGDGQEYCDALEAALYENVYPRIEATFAPGSHVVYTDDALSTLVPYLTVKLLTSASDVGTVVPSTDYTLSGTLVAGQSVIWVSYNDLSTKFMLTAVDWYNQYEWSITNGLIRSRVGNLRNTADKVGIQTNNSQRMVMVTDRGLYPYVRYQDGVVLSEYPIPVPDDAQSVTISIEPSSQWVLFGTRYADDTNETYTLSNIDYSGGYFEGSKSLNLPITGQKKYLTLVSKYDSAGTEYPTPPSNVTVLFSREEVE